MVFLPTVKQIPMWLASSASELQVEASCCLSAGDTWYPAEVLSAVEETDRLRDKGRLLLIPVKEVGAVGMGG